MSGDTYEDFAQRVGLIGVVNVLDWDINDVFNDKVMTQRLTGTVSDAADLA